MSFIAGKHSKCLLRGKYKNSNFRLVTTWSPLAVAFNTRPSNRFRLGIFKNRVGLFRHPSLSSFEGLYAMKENVEFESNKLLNEACSTDRQRKIIQIFDDLSDNLCKVADLAEFVRMMHPQIEFHSAAEEACISVSGIVERLNTNKELYNALKEVQQNGDKFQMTDVDKHVVDLFLFDFEQCGIHLPEKDRATVVHYNNCILQYGQKFVNNASQPRLVSKHEVPAVLQQHFNVINEDQLCVNGYSDITDELGREIAYKVYLAKSEKQEKLLDSVLEYRDKLAKICGFPSYAHRASRGSTAETPEFITDFLNVLNTRLKNQVESDFYLLNKIKSLECNNDLCMWDIAYYVSRVKREWLKINVSDYSPYFSLGTCMDGINTLFKNIFGISLVNEEIDAGETWHSDVYKLAVIHETEGLLGYIYCDFYQRIEKPNQDCHYTVVGGRRLSDGSYQNPIVVVALNFPAPDFSTPTLLSPGMVETLFHEMGHAIHSMLGRTEYQHVTGTRCTTDFAEVPSVLMEFFASDARVLRTFAKHYKTGEPIPESMLERMCASRKMFCAAEMQAQVFYSVLDLTYHTDNVVGRTTEVLAEIQSQYYPIPYVHNTAWQLKFSHLIGYGAKYYSYLMSRAIAASIWHSHFKKNPFDRDMGEKYRRECLAHGGGKPPRMLVKDYLNKDITPENVTESLLVDIDVDYSKFS